MGPISALPLIELESVSKAYPMGRGLFWALQDVSLQVNEGERVAVIGPSGSGKSTLLHLIGGLHRPTSGSIWVEGENFEVFSNDALASFRNKTIGFVFQSFYLIPRSTVFENVRLPLVYARDRVRDAGERVRELLSSVGLEGKSRNRSNTLSGGEQQRVAIARALVNDPSIVLADEPTGNLDSKTGNDILRLLFLLRDAGKTLLIVTHNEAVARRADRVVVLRDGRAV